MTYESAYKILSEYGQTHLLEYYNELDDSGKRSLLEQVELLDFSVLKLLENRDKLTEKGRITPLTAMQLGEIEKHREEFEAIGIEQIRKGKVGAVLLAGGMGTRLGSDNPKGMFNIGVTRELYIFECLINNLTDVVRRAGTFIPLFIMTSDKNDAATRKFLKEKNYFGYNPEYVAFFMQEMAPATDYNGRVYLEEKGKISMSPNGNGGWFLSMKRAGVLDKIKKSNIEWLNVFAVDNVLQRICDPCFIGATVARSCAIGSKVVKKAAPDEKVGVMCLENGHPSIVEYYELTEEMMNAKDSSGDPAYNFGVILNYLFRFSDLEKIAQKKMPYHIVEKKIPFMDADDKTVKPEKPNGFKFETLILDMIYLSESCLPFEVPRNHEFAPVKNKTGIDSVETARALLTENGVII